MKRKYRTWLAASWLILMTLLPGLYGNWWVPVVIWIVLLSIAAFVKCLCSLSNWYEDY